MDFVNSFEEGIFNEFGIDVKENGHVHFLVGIQPLLLKAKALYFVEVLPRLKWNHIVSTDTINGFVGWVLCLQEKNASNFIIK